MDEFRAQVPNAGRAYRCCGTCTPKPPISRVKRRRLKQQTRLEVEYSVALTRPSEMERVLNEGTIRRWFGGK